MHGLYPNDASLLDTAGRLLIVAGTPFGAPGAANLLRLAHAPTRFRRKAGQSPSQN